MHPLATLASLPSEVLLILLTGLSRHDLTTCGRVCQEWNKVITPVLYKELLIRSPLEYDRFKSSGGAQLLAKHGLWIQTLNTCFVSVLEWAAVTAEPGSSSLECHSNGSHLSSQPLQKLACSGIKYLSCPIIPKVGGMEDTLSSDMAPHLLSILKGNQKLLYLELHCPVLNDPEQETTLEGILAHCPPSLQSLELWYERRYDLQPNFENMMDKAADDSGENAGGSLHFAHDTLEALKTVYVCGFVPKNKPLLQFLKRCPHLQSLILDQMIDPHFDQLPPVLQRFCPELINLEVKNESYSENDCLSSQQLVDLIACNKDLVMDGTNYSAGPLPVQRGWRTIAIPFHNGFGPRTTEALSAHYPTLENLRLDGCTQFTSQDVQELLCSAPRLRRFSSVTDQEVVQARNVVLFAEDIVNSSRPWACADSLVSLRVIIKHVPRPDVPKNHNGRPLGPPFHHPEMGMEASIRVQRAIYKQIGVMVHLQELVLGLDDTDNGDHCADEEDWEAGYYDENNLVVAAGFHYDSLAFTLESGLDLLKSLKDLRVLDLTRTAERVGEAEMSWMREHWPRMVLGPGVVDVDFQDQRVHAHSPWVGFRAFHKNWIDGANVFC